jgi:hypothetical protein
MAPLGDIPKGRSFRARTETLSRRPSFVAVILRTCIVTILLLAGPLAIAAQTDQPSGLEFTGLPALSFDSDEGVGYGVLAEVYQYGDGTMEPYLWTLQPRVLLTTRGRRDFTLFLDAPHLLPDGWRVNGYLGLEKRIKTPYYGLGNETLYDPASEDPAGPNPHYYGFGRLRRSALVNLQRNLTGTPLWALFGVGMVATEVDPTPEGVGSTLYAAEAGPAGATYWTNYIRAGLIWDSRDREAGPRAGTWSELVVHWVNEGLGADVSFTRWSLMDRRYYSLTQRLVFAHRYFLQGVSGDVPIHQLQRVQTSFRQGEGLGGSATVRGLPKNRFAGKGMLVWNAELRWRVMDFRALGRSFHTVLSTFLDQGRVWSGGVRMEELFSGLHRGYGVGVRVGMGENFVVAMDVADSSQASLPIYLGLGYFF